MGNNNMDNYAWQMIANDTAFYNSLNGELLERESSPVIYLALLPYLSLYVHEGYSFIADRSPEAAEFLRREHTETIRQSRNRIKILDSRRSSLDDFIRHFRLITQYHHQFFIQKHKGALGWFKRLIQTDLGLFLYDGRLVGTTHIAQLNLGENPSEDALIVGLSQEDVPNRVRSIGFDLGEFLGAMVSVLPILTIRTPGARYRVDDEALTNKDVKAEQFYQCAFPGIAMPEVSAVLTLVVVHLNFAKELMRRLVTVYSPALFKFKFLSLFHATSSLQTLQDYCYSIKAHSETSKHKFRDILSDPFVRKVRRTTTLRNALVHYDPGELSRLLTREATNFETIILAHFNGREMHQIDEAVDEQIDRISEIFGEWIEI